MGLFLHRPQSFLQVSYECLVSPQVASEREAAAAAREAAAGGAESLGAQLEAERAAAAAEVAAARREAEAAALAASTARYRRGGVGARRWALCFHMSSRRGCGPGIAAVPACAEAAGCRGAGCCVIRLHRC
jgi:hypothetical protein